MGCGCTISMLDGETEARDGETLCWWPEQVGGIDRLCGLGMVAYSFPDSVSCLWKWLIIGFTIPRGQHEIKGNAVQPVKPHQAERHKEVVVTVVNINY